MRLVPSHLFQVMLRTLTRAITSSLRSKRNIRGESTKRTAKDIVKELQKTFEVQGIAEPLSSAEYIVAHACGQKTVELY